MIEKIKINVVLLLDIFVCFIVRDVLFLTVILRDAEAGGDVQQHRDPQRGQRGHLL